MVVPVGPTCEEYAEKVGLFCGLAPVLLLLISTTSTHIFVCAFFSVGTTHGYHFENIPLLTCVCVFHTPPGSARVPQRGPHGGRGCGPWLHPQQKNPECSAGPVQLHPWWVRLQAARQYHLHCYGLCCEAQGRSPFEGGLVLGLATEHHLTVELICHQPPLLSLPLYPGGSKQRAPPYELRLCSRFLPVKREFFIAAITLCQGGSGLGLCEVLSNN